MHESWTTPRDRTATSSAAARGSCGRPRFRVDGTATARWRPSAAHLRETGNLLFHLSLLLLLVAVALGSLFGLQGHRCSSSRVTGFSNTVTAYDSFTPVAPRSTRATLAAVHGVTSTSSRCATRPSGDQRGAPRDFRAAVTYTTRRTRPSEAASLRVNHPLTVDGTKVFLLGNGYAPVFTVRDATGAVVFSGPVPFLPRDGNIPRPAS